MTGKRRSLRTYITTPPCIGAAIGRRVGKCPGGVLPPDINLRCGDEFGLVEAAIPYAEMLDDIGGSYVAAGRIADEFGRVVASASIRGEPMSGRDMEAWVRNKGPSTPSVRLDDSYLWPWDMVAILACIGVGVGRRVAQCPSNVLPFNVCRGDTFPILLQACNDALACWRLQDCYRRSGLTVPEFGMRIALHYGQQYADALIRGERLDVESWFGSYLFNMPKAAA